MSRQILPIFAVGCLIVCGCDTRQKPAAQESPNLAPPNVATSSATIDRVRKIVSEQMRVSIDKITPMTSLGELGADELDFVELIMELEDSFSITISDAAAEGLLENSEWQTGMKNLTIQKLSALVDNLSKTKPSSR